MGQKSLRQKLTNFSCQLIQKRVFDPAHWQIDILVMSLDPFDRLFCIYIQEARHKDTSERLDMVPDQAIRGNLPYLGVTQLLKQVILKLFRQIIKLLGVNVKLSLVFLLTNSAYLMKIISKLLIKNEDTNFIHYSAEIS